MPMSNTTAAIQASNLETFFRIKRPDLNLTQTTIAQQLQAITPALPTDKNPTPATDALTIAAAWLLADHLARRRTPWHSFDQLPHTLEHLTTQPIAPPAALATASTTQGDSLEAQGGSAGPCPAHPWQPLARCAACYSEIKAGHRHPDAYGVKN